MLAFVQIKIAKLGCQKLLMLHLFSKVATIAIVRCRRRQLITPHHRESSLDWGDILTTEHLVNLYQKATVKNTKRLSKKSIFRCSQIHVSKKREKLARWWSSDFDRFAQQSWISNWTSKLKSTRRLSIITASAKINLSLESFYTLQGKKNIFNFA